VCERNILQSANVLRFARGVFLPGTERGQIRPVAIKDAKAYAEMMRRSESGWPWSRGVPYTVRAARESITGAAAIGNYVAEVDQKIIGCCTLLRGLWDQESAYVGYLNVEPSYQRQGFGRRLLRAAVDTAIQEGFDRVNLNTWPGNLQALPLYKKMGFFWVPETMVEMVSLIPAVLGHPMFKGFFTQVPDWYSAQVRDLSPKPDILDRDGIRIFQYRFRSGANEVEATVDRRGLWLTGGSNKDLEIWIHPENEISPEGFPQSVFWEVTNKGSSEIQATLLVEAPECVEMLEHPPKAFGIRAGGRVKLEGRFRIDPRSKRKES